MRLGIADDGGPAAVGEDHPPLGHRIDRVVGPCRHSGRNSQEPLAVLSPKSTSMRPHYRADQSARSRAAKPGAGPSRATDWSRHLHHERSASAAAPQIIDVPQ